MSDPSQLFILVAVLLAATVGVIFLVVASKRSPLLDKRHFQAKWLEIEHSLDGTNPASWQLAILNADKLLDSALVARRLKGQTMGERMKSAQNIWRNAQHVWNAHKIRNQLAHEVDTSITFEMTRRALAAYRQGLKDLGAI